MKYIQLLKESEEVKESENETNEEEEGKDQELKNMIEEILVSWKKWVKNRRGVRKEKEKNFETRMNLETTRSVE